MLRAADLEQDDEAQRVLADYERAGAGVMRGHTRLTLERLHGGELDVGVLTLPVSQPKLRILDLGRDELVAIVAPSHPWGERTRIQASEFAGQPLLMHERRSQTFTHIERVLLETGVFPQIAMEMDHLEAVVEMVRVGLKAFARLCTERLPALLTA